ncbi:hypothetical protein OF001_U400004 [Pseudomonas sp. OF001]|nr:hypothetical protein OF001_U400004 [Pseudomonas sp. OF001]
MMTASISTVFMPSKSDATPENVQYVQNLHIVMSEEEAPWWRIAKPSPGFGRCRPWPSVSLRAVRSRSTGWPGPTRRWGMSPR